MVQTRVALSIQFLVLKVVYNTLFALPRNHIFLGTLKLYVLGLQNANDFHQPYILATSATFVSISCECPRFHASVMRTARLFA